MKVAAVSALRGRLLHAAQHRPAPQQNEQAACWDLVASGAALSLLRFDLGSFSFL